MEEPELIVYQYAKSVQSIISYATNQSEPDV